MPVAQTIKTKHRPVLAYTNDIEASALRQLRNVASLPFVHHHVAAMPDVHAGIGATVGSVIPTKGAIIPAAVGVDIGCGMNAVRLSLSAGDLPDNLKPLRLSIEAAVPVGFGMHKSPAATAGLLDSIWRPLEKIAQKHPRIRKMQKQFDSTWANQIGTLGGGNHFIEVCLDEQDRVWVMLHSGSRGIGNVIGRYFIALARKDMGRHISNMPDKDLAYFTQGAEHFADYVQAVEWAQNYAMLNRQEMMRLVLNAMVKNLPKFSTTQEAINCHHNYVTQEHHYGAEVFVTRKGAIRAGLGELGIIPGSMGTRSYIVRGKGSAEAFNSCAHGAGRRMSRTAARREFSIADMEEQTRGVECRKDKNVIDEIPRAYKDIDQVMANQTDLVEVVHTVKQVICVKG